MAQHDFTIDNGPGKTVRLDIQSAVQALVSNNSGATAPTTTYAGMWWLDTSTGPNGILKIRDAANATWISKLDLNVAGVVKNPVTAAGAAPVGPAAGDMWLNTTTGVLSIFQGGNWIPVGGGAASGATAPTAPKAGDLWVNSTDDKLHVYSGGTWHTIGDTSAYLPLAGGIITGNLEVRGVTTCKAENAVGDAILLNGRTSDGYARIGSRGTGPGACFIGFYADGKIDFGSVTPSAINLTINANGSVVARDNITAYSDAKLKTNVRTIDDALSLVENMRGVFFDRVDNGKAGVGVIAQEMQKILPEVVEQGETLSVAYGNLVGVLIEAVKELSARVAILEARHDD
jgi:hypothetical protein